MQKNRVLILIACFALITVLLSGTVTTATPPIQTSAITFKTPEEAITAYLEALTKGDFEKIVATSAISDMSEKFKFDLYVDRIRALSPQSMAPATSPFYVELNKAQLSSQLAFQVKNLVYGLLSTEDVSSGKIIRMDLEHANKFINEVDFSRLSTLELKKIGQPNTARMNTEQYLNNAAKIARVYGADESTERVALFTFEQNYYFIGFSLLRYGDNWKINSQSSPMSNASVMGTPEKTTPAEFDSMLN